MKNSLLVEGKNDELVIKAICQKTKIDQTFDIREHDDKFEKSGIDNLLDAIPLVVKTMDGSMRLGIVVDTDYEKGQRWQQLKDRFEKLGYRFPEICPSDGLILDASPRLPKLGIWLMPDNATLGMLETFLKYLIESSDKLQEKADHILNEIERDNINLYDKTIHRDKAFMHTWLAWQTKPGDTLKFAVLRSYLTTNTELCNRFVSWLNRLFNE